MLIAWARTLPAAVALIIPALAAAQSIGMTCNLSTQGTAIQPSDTDAPVGDLLLTCQGGVPNRDTSTPVPTVNWTITLPRPVSSPIVSTSGGRVSDVLLFIDDAASLQQGTAVAPGFGSNAPPALCTYSAASNSGCPAYPNVSGGVPVMTSAPNPLGSPNPAPPAANIYQGIVNGNSVTFFGVPILPPGTTGARTFRFTNLRVNAAAGASASVVASLYVLGSGAPQLSLNQTQVTLGATQSANAIFAAGNNLPNSLNVAPGQITNLFVQGIGSKLGFGVFAQNFPLPTALGGISVTLNQTLGPSGPTRSFPVPLLGVRLFTTCTPCSNFAALTIQIPFEISAAVPNQTTLVVSENGVPGGVFNVTVQPDQVHGARSCDLQVAGGTCTANAVLVTHGNGTLVNSFNPAKIGEELVMYAFGLGSTAPAVPTGQATPGPASATQPIQLNFDYRPNAAPSYTLTLPSVCLAAPACPQIQPVYAGLTPGYAGLYQVNFVVPPPPPGTAVCNASSDLAGKPPSGIASNLTVSIIAPNSSDGSGICVDTSGS